MGFSWGAVVLKRYAAAAFIFYMVASQLYAIFANLNTYPFTDYHLFAEPVSITDLAVYRVAARTTDGSMVFSTESPLVYEYQNALSEHLHDFVVIQHNRFFDPRREEWAARQKAHNGLRRFSVDLDTPIGGDVLLMRTTATPTGSTWRRLEFHSEIVASIYP